METIMVHMSDERWTMEAMHLASAVARNMNAKIVLVRLVLANNPGLLGWGIASPTAKEQHQMEKFATVADDYGVDFCVQPMQFITLVDALAQAAQHRHATALFAHLPQSRFSIWREFCFWNLKRQIPGCSVYLLDEDFVSTSKRYLFPITIGDRRKVHK